MHFLYKPSVLFVENQKFFLYLNPLNLFMRCLHVFCPVIKARWLQKSDLKNFNVFVNWQFNDIKLKN